MPQDAFTLKFIAEELENLLIGGKISKIVQPDKDTLSLFIYTHSGTVKLAICLSAKYCRISLTDREVVSPKAAPNFCMLLRKHLQNAQITDVKQIPFERIVYFDMECVSEFELKKMRLYLEIMGKYSNAVLTENGEILGALKQTAIGENTRRILFSGVKYSLPEPQDKTAPDDLEGLSAILELQGDRAKLLAEKVKGISYQTAAEMAEALGENMTAEDVKSYICGGQLSPCVIFDGGKAIDFRAKSSSRSAVKYDSILAAQRAFYDGVTSFAEFAARQKKYLSAVSSALKKVEKRLAVIEQKLLDCADMESVKLKGELITANIYMIEKGDEKLRAVNYYDEAGGTVEIALDKTLTPAQNAQRYYKKYNKLKRTRDSVTEQRVTALAELDYLTSLIAHINSSEDMRDLNDIEDELKECGILKAEPVKGKKAEKPSSFRTFRAGGFTIVAGRNNIQNDRLVKSLSENDIWLHTQKYHSSHVGILTEGRSVPDGVLLIAAEICAHYSDGRSGGKIPVDYTRRKFVKKPRGGAAGFVNYTDYKTLLVNPDGHAELKDEK